MKADKSSVNSLVQQKLVSKNLKAIVDLDPWSAFNNVIPRKEKSVM
jgi:hypothetical protein